MADGEFTHSFALFDADHRLVDWDEGFANEWLYAAPVLRRGITYPELLKAALSDRAAQQFVKDNYGEGNVSQLIRARIGTFGTNRSWRYTSGPNRVVSVDEHLTALGGVRRLARDITNETEAQTALAEAQQRLEAADSDVEGVLTESRRKPDRSRGYPGMSFSSASSFPTQRLLRKAIRT